MDSEAASSRPLGRAHDVPLAAGRTRLNRPAAILTTNTMPSLQTNFGRNISWQPAVLHVPGGETELLQLLDRHAGRHVRAVASRHAWSALCATDGVSVDLRQLNTVSVERAADGTTWATIGAGCTISRALQQLRAQSGVTLPTLGAITRQTIAGALSTATHGSGRPSLSHFPGIMRLAQYGPDGRARLVELHDGPALRAARCALGCMGIVTAVRLPCVPDYAVVHRDEGAETLAEVLAGEAEYPLQSFLLLPWSWKWYVWRRRVARAEERSAPLRRFTRRAAGAVLRDTLQHAGLKVLLAGGSPAMVRQYMKRLMPLQLRPSSAVVDRSDHVLTLAHERFRHVEMELFVPASRLALALAVSRHVLTVAAGAPAPSNQDAEARASGLDLAAARATVADAGFGDAIGALRGRYTQHYPLFCRRVLSDDTLVSMSADASEPLHTISFFTYERDLKGFEATATVLARVLRLTCDARPHWGKWFPLSLAEIEPLYPHLSEFRAQCIAADERGTFRNEFTGRVLGLPPGPVA